HYLSLEGKTIRSLFASDSDRVAAFSAEGAGIFLDYSKNLMDREAMKLLLQLAQECGLKDGISAMQTGEKINEREGRAVLHYALRSKNNRIDLEGENVMELVKPELKKLEKISNSIHSGKWTGFTGKRIKNVVNIGIGGSDLGPQMVCNALRPYWSEVTPYFLSNIDAAQWEEIHEEIDPEETVFIVASKTFTTDETMTNARTVRSWFVDQLGEEALSKHFFAVSTNLDEVNKFGIPNENIVGFWDWVGGRFSLWSSIGLSIACAVGYKKFEELLDGAAEMDEHFFYTPFESNLPVIMALLTVWQVNFCKQTTHAILPYDHRLRDFPRFLQQMIMESNGKQMDRNGNRVKHETCPVYFGEPGTNGQHAFYQLLHQGTEIVPADFIACIKPAHEHDEHHKKLLANCFAQSEALMDGNPSEDPFRNFEGNRPSNTLLMDELNPKNLGALIALYEQQVFVKGIIWNIFS
ncbi:MAG: glucose-6-phosphate isomerase, partial [Flavobacteriales bacterium]|nr:glucose-6-phosphate isomerase [Flavobacteriales bacterium]